MLKRLQDLEVLALDGSRQLEESQLCERVDSIDLLEGRVAPQEGQMLEADHAGEDGGFQQGEPSGYHKLFDTLSTASRYESVKRDECR